MRWSRDRQALVALLVVACAIRVLVAWVMPNLVWPDEIYQSMEQAHRIVFGNGIVPWEFRDGTRSWMLPGFLACVMKVTAWVSSSSAAHLVASAAALSAISLAPVWGAFRLGLREAGIHGAIVAGGFAALWFELVYFAPKALSEVVAGNLLALGLVLGMTWSGEAARPSRRRVIVVAATLALAAMVRIQLAPAALVAFVLAVRDLPRDHWRTAVIAGGVVVVAAGLLDWITWSYPFQSYVENVRVNIVKGKSANYGVADWFAYFEVYGRIWGLWAVPILALAAYGARRAPRVALCALLVLLAHLPIAHKEYRFAYPAMALVVVLAGLGAAAAMRWIAQRSTPRLASLAAIGILVGWGTASLRLANEFHGSKTQLAIGGPEQLHWVRRSGGLFGMQRLGEAPGLCGVGFVGLGWQGTGGYTWLHRDVPLYLFPTVRALLENVAVVNGVITPPTASMAFGPFQRDMCWEDACVFTRSGSCTTMPGYDFNDVIKQVGW